MEYADKDASVLLGTSNSTPGSIPNLKNTRAKHIPANYSKHNPSKDTPFKITETHAVYAGPARAGPTAPFPTSHSRRMVLIIENRTLASPSGMFASESQTEPSLCSAGKVRTGLQRPRGCMTTTTSGSVWSP